MPLPALLSSCADRRPLDSEMDRRKLEVIPQCLSIAFKTTVETATNVFGEDLFERFVSVNRSYFWNLNLKEVFENCHLVGHIRPHCLLIGGQDIYIQSIKLAYRKRLLKAPEPFVISVFGELDAVQCAAVVPSPFVSLDESLCYVIYDLNLRGGSADFDSICGRLAEWYPSLELPPQFLVLATLRGLLDAGQVYYTGYGYNVMTSDTVIVANWLGQHNPARSVAASDHQVGRSRPQGSLSGSSATPVADSQIYSKFDRPHWNSEAPMFSPFFPATLEHHIKHPKARSAVKQFFSRLKARHHKSRKSSTAPEKLNMSSSCHEDWCRYSLDRSQPRFVSCGADLLSRYSSTCNEFSKYRTLVPEAQWLWNSGMRSLSNLNSPGKRSTSSHSKLSTLAIDDESPYRNVPPKKEPFDTHSKARFRNEIKKEPSVPKACRPSSGDYSEFRYKENGLHPSSGSRTKGTLDRLPKQKKQVSHQKHKSLELAADAVVGPLSPAVSPTEKSTSQSNQRMTRSFSSRLSTLDGVREGAKWSALHSRRRVLFNDSCGTMY